jgi:hypothetical protein
VDGNRVNRPSAAKCRDRLLPITFENAVSGKLRVAGHTSCLSGFAGHRSTRADQSIELENLELD